MSNILNHIYDILDMSRDNGLICSEEAFAETVVLRKDVNQLKKIGVDAAYYLRDSDGKPRIPVVYFSALSQEDPARIARLHQRAWNAGDAPLLFVVTPDSLLIYNAYAEPAVSSDGSLDVEAGLIEQLQIANSLVQQKDALEKYSRLQLESGAFWRSTRDRFDVKGKVDSTLMSNLCFMRERLVESIAERSSEGIDKIVEVVQSLLSRSIFIKYLEERKDTAKNTVFPPGFFASFEDSAESYVDILRSKRATYALFEALRNKFNGDVFDYCPLEQTLVTQEDLNLLQEFLLGDCESDTGQMSLWPLYDFDIIPIQLISSIYELFFHFEASEGNLKGTYYSPLHLVEFAMDELYDWEGDSEPVTFLDPACGSGIFLVEAYRRIVCRYFSHADLQTITGEQLALLMTKSIYGVDVNREALKVAALSLCLAMCDFLEPRCIWEELSFPQLVGTNLIHADFFDAAQPFNAKKFSYIIGNPPWQSSLTKAAEDYLKVSGCAVGDKQIAQAFSIKCAQICRPDGYVCLIMPSKSLLFNRSEPNRKYRKEMFESSNIIEIINLSLYRKILFERASAPAAILIFQPRCEKLDRHPIVYCTPKPQYTIEDARSFTIDPSDICRIPADLVWDDRIWKVGMWGSPRDLELVDRIKNSFDPMSNFLDDRKCVFSEGFKKGNGKAICTDFLGMPMVYAKNMVPYRLRLSALGLMQEDRLERTVASKREIFRAPHLLIKQSPVEGRIWSALLDYDAVFNHSILGVHGEESALKYLSLVIGSSLFSYWQILTNRKWLVERDELEEGDILGTPLPVPREEDLARAEELFDLACSGKAGQGQVDSYVFELYGVRGHEKHQVEDVIDYTFNYYKKKERSRALEPPTEDLYLCYWDALTEVLSNSFDSSIIYSGVVYAGDSPLSVLVISFEDSVQSSLEIRAGSAETISLLRSLDEYLVERKEASFVRRNMRIYKSDKVYVIKPALKKYWTFSAGYRDGDEIFADIVRSVR